MYEPEAFDGLESVASERHDLVGGHGHETASMKAVHELLPTRLLYRDLSDDQGVAAALHVDLGTGADAEFIG